MINVAALEIGMYHSTLKDSYVIFICTFDPFRHGDACYSYSMSCEEIPELKLKDERLLLFFNTKDDMSTLPDKTREFLEYIETGN